MRETNKESPLVYNMMEFTNQYFTPKLTRFYRTECCFKSTWSVQFYLVIFVKKYQNLVFKYIYIYTGGFFLKLLFIAQSVCKYRGFLLILDCAHGAQPEWRVSWFLVNWKFETVILYLLKSSHPENSLKIYCEKILIYLHAFIKGNYSEILNS